jgi:hypothetical protein
MTGGLGLGFSLVGAPVQYPTRFRLKAKSLLSASVLIFLKGGRCGLRGRFFSSSSKTTWMAFSSCGLWPSIISAGTCSTSISGGTPMLSTTHPSSVQMASYHEDPQEMNWLPFIAALKRLNWKLRKKILIVLFTPNMVEGG